MNPATLSVATPDARQAPGTQWAANAGRPFSGESDKRTGTSPLSTVGWIRDNSGHAMSLSHPGAGSSLAQWTGPWWWRDR